MQIECTLEVKYASGVQKQKWVNKQKDVGMHMSQRKNSSSRWRTEESSAFSRLFLSLAPSILSPQSCIFPALVFHCSGDKHKGLVHRPSVLIPGALRCFAHWWLLFVSAIVDTCGHLVHTLWIPVGTYGYWMGRIQIPCSDKGNDYRPNGPVSGPWLRIPLDSELSALSEAPSAVAESTACCFLSSFLFINAQHNKYISLLQRCSGQIQIGNLLQLSAKAEYCPVESYLGLGGGLMKGLFTAAVK